MHQAVEKVVRDVSQSSCTLEKKLILSAENQSVWALKDANQAWLRGTGIKYGAKSKGTNWNFSYEEFAFLSLRFTACMVFQD